VLAVKSKYILSLLCILSVKLTSCDTSDKKSEIDRYKLVTRHNISHTKTDPLNSLTVGNGEFAFTVDITGLQTFPDFYEQGIPLGTQSNWGWHSYPNPNKYSLKDVYKKYKVGGDTIDYVYQYTEDADQRKNEASRWLRENPHRLHLGLIGLEIANGDSTHCTINDIEDPVQKLDLWKGEIKSCFRVNGIPAEITTYCHQDIDMVAVQIKSDLLVNEKIKIKIRFPYASHDKFSTACDWNNPDKHTTYIEDSTENMVIFSRKLDNARYFTRLEWQNKAVLKYYDSHTYYLCPLNDNNTFKFSCGFSKGKNTNRLPGFAETEKNNRRHWREFWESGGAVDFSGCSDPRAFELERRIILSQYLTKIQCSGSLPPQETGLTYNSWHGKFHLEMHWWHAVHFILWNRAGLIEQQLDYYFDIIDKARFTAEQQGYKGARWPKMIAPDGRESPSTIGTFLIWQQPHIIYYSELLYNYYDKNDSILEKYKDLVIETADFMASYARMDSSLNRYILGPALIPAQECFDPGTTVNPAFELAYWYWGLKTAQNWRQRLGIGIDDHWQNVINNLADIPVSDSLYLFTGNATDSYENPRYLADHPMVTGITGILPETDMIDKKIMLKTLKEIHRKWKWESIWGWDIPMLAMNATVLDKPDLAVDFLMMDTRKNTYMMSGHNYQDERLRLYLPGNGGLLTAIAMMCTYRNEEGFNGFPDDGNWNVRYENLNNLY
jgi:hypothetical protein